MGSDIFDSTYGIPTIDPYTCDNMMFLSVFSCGMVSYKTLKAQVLVKEDEDWLISYAQLYSFDLYS